MKYTALFTACDEGGWMVQCAEIPEAISQGETLPEARENLKKALRLVLEYKADEALKSNKNVDRVEEIAFR